MRILIQDTQTSLFYKGENNWTRKDHEAFDFDNTTVAERFCRDQKIDTAQIVVKFERLPDLRLACRAQDLIFSGVKPGDKVRKVQVMDDTAPGKQHGGSAVGPVLEVVKVANGPKDPPGSAIVSVSDGTHHFARNLILED